MFLRKMGVRSTARLHPATNKVGEKQREGSRGQQSP